MRWERLAVLQERVLTGQRASEFLEWLLQMEEELRGSTWEMLSARKMEASDLHDINSVAVTLRSLKDFLKSKADDGRVARMEEEEDAEENGTDGTD